MVTKERVMYSASRHQTVMVDAVWPKAGLARDTALVLGGSLLIALAAQIQIVLPFSPVPATGQTFAVLLIGALYGSKRAPATVVTYIVLGIFGLPVFAGGGAGIARMAGPTAGYLVGFAAATCVVGLLSERGWDRRSSTTAASMIIGNGIIYIFGIAWLSRFVGWEAVLSAGFVPFIAGDALKIALATILLPTGWRVIGLAGRK
jgi:biotin transport system substrate-specific component